MKKLSSTLFIISFILYSIIFLFFTQKNPNILPVSINYIVFGGFFLLTIFYNMDILLKIKKKLIVISLIFILFTLSVVYAPDKIIAIKQWSSFFLLYYMMIFMYKYFEKKHIHTFLFLIFIVTLFYLTLSIYTYQNNLDYQNLYVGLTGNRHNTSLILGVYAISNTTLLFFCKRKIIHMVILLSLIAIQVLIYLTFARIGFYVELLYLIFIIPFFFNNIQNKITKYAIIASIIIILYLFIFYTFNQMIILHEYITYAIERGSTGRDTINQVLYKWQQSNGLPILLLGFGMGALEYYKTLSDLFIRDVNNIFATIFIIGYIGFFLYLLLLVQLVYILFKSRNNKYSYLFASLALSIFLIPSETSWLNFNYFVTIYMYFSIIMAIKFKKGEHLI